MLILPILCVFTVTNTKLLVSGTTSCTSDDKQAGDACDEMEQAVSFLQFARRASVGKDNLAQLAAPVTITAPQVVVAQEPSRMAPPTLSSRLSSSTERCLAALRQSVDDIIGTHLKRAPRPFMLWDPATNANVDDNLITLAEESLLQPYSPSVCCIASCSPSLDARCPTTPAEAAKGNYGTYILHGGGNWGDLYAQPQFSRISLLVALASCCPNTMIIGMPQNLFYNDTKKEQDEAFRIESAIKKFTTPPIFFWRDRESFSKALSLYPTANNVISPEVAWALHPLSQYDARTEYPYDMLVSAHVEESVEGTIQNLDEFKLNVAAYDSIAKTKPKVLYSDGWVDLYSQDVQGNYSWKKYNVSLLSHRLSAAVSWLRSAPVVVTDKLHMALLALLAGAKDVFVDNSYHKLHKTMEASFALAGHDCANMRSEVLGVGATVEKKPSTIPGIVPADDFQSAATMVLQEGRLAEARKPPEEDLFSSFEASKSQTPSSSKLIEEASPPQVAPQAGQAQAAQAQAAQAQAMQAQAAQAQAAPVQAAHAELKASVEDAREDFDMDLMLKLAESESQVKQLQSQLQEQSGSKKQTGSHSFLSESCPLYVGILSAPPHKKRRAAVRAAYLDELRERFSSRGIVAEFLIGHVPYQSKAQGLVATPEELQIEHDINAEAAEKGDIRRINLPEAYQYLPDKVLNIFQRGVDKQCAYIMKIDDDQELNMTSTIEFLEARDPQELLYAGKIFWPQQAVSFQKGADGTFAPYFSGHCYLMSWKLAHQIVEVHADHTAMFITYGSSSEDVDVGHWVQWEERHGSKVTIQEVPSFARSFRHRTKVEAQESWLQLYRRLRHRHEASPWKL